MKKIVLAAIVLILIIGLSYVKTLRDYDRSRAFYEGGKIDGARELDESKSEADSLKLAAGEQQVAFADSLVKKDIAYQSQIDSLEGVIDGQSQQISSLKSKTTTPATATATKTVAKKPTLSKHEKILSYYKKRYASLPGDLSDYEKRIAVNEIREETSLKFSISLQELKKIRDKYKLTY